MTVDQSRDPRGDRAFALRARLADAGLDALLVASLPNIRWLTGFTGSAGLCVVTARDTVLITDFRYRTQARAEVGDTARVEIEGTSLWSRLWTVLPTLVGAGLVGFESVGVTHADWTRIGEGGNRWEWRPEHHMIEALREMKDPTEVAHIRRAVAIAEEALGRLLPQVKVGMTELEVGARLEFELRTLGSEAHPFETIVAAGERSALPHARCSTRELRRGDLLVVDFGATAGGYCSDITRTFAIGSVTGEQRAMYDVVREANAVASARVRAGMRGRDADAIARDHIEHAGMGAEFGHSLGHGIGLEVHEGPRLSKVADSPLPIGAVVTIEPGVYREGVGGVRIEDDVLLTESGAELLTTFPRQLQIIGI